MSASRFGPPRAGSTSLANESVAYGSGARPIAEHTTTGKPPFCSTAKTRDAAISRNSALASDEPPNF